jgi:VWFA-related protein
MRARLTAAALLLVAALGPASAQQPTFRSEINYIEFPVRVRDRQGHFVGDLTQSDFQVFEDGRQQDIASFTFVNLPIPDPKKPLVEPAAGTLAARPFVLREGESVEGRVFLFVLDDYHILPQYSFQVKTIVQSFVKKRMGPHDIAAIVYTSTTRGQDFTQDRSALISSLGRFMGSLDALEPGGTQIVKSIAALDKIRSMSEALGRIHGRHKALVFISPTLGCVTQQQAMRDVKAPITPTGLTSGTLRVVNTPMPDTTPSRCFESLRESVRLATQANVSIYAFDPTTLESPGWVSPMIDGRGGPEVAMQKARASEPNSVSVFDGMRTLADETGGFTVTNVNNFDKALDRIVREHSSYYVIGYYTTNDKADGKTRKNAIALNRTDVQVVYRPTYTAPKE